MTTIKWFVQRAPLSAMNLENVVETTIKVYSQLFQDMAFSINLKIYLDVDLKS